MVSTGNVDFSLSQQQACAQGSHAYLLLILVHTSFRSYDRREACRETWAAKNGLDESVLLFFVINEHDVDNGDLPGHKVTLEKENEINQDIILTKYSHQDRFTNFLVPSSVWITTFCSRVSYVLNIVDTSVVDLDKLVPFLKSFQGASQQMLLCDYILPNDSTVFSHAQKDQGYCSPSAFITTPSVLRNLAVELQNSEEHPLESEAWLSEICNQASIPIATTWKLFTGNRKKPSMLKELMNTNYPNSEIMVAIVRSQVPGRETVLIHQAWKLIQSHRSFAMNQGHMIHDSPDSGSIVMFAAILMLIDFAVIFFIFTFIFCKRRRKV